MTVDSTLPFAEVTNSVMWVTRMKNTFGEGSPFHCLV